MFDDCQCLCCWHYDHLCQVAASTPQRLLRCGGRCLVASADLVRLWICRVAAFSSDEGHTLVLCVHPCPLFDLCTLVVVSYKL